METSRPRLLFMRLGSMGDLILTTPSVRAARNALPDAHIAIVTSAALAPIYESNPHVNEIVAVDRRRLDRSPSEIMRIVRTLRQGRYHVSVDLHGKVKTALLTRAARVPRRIGRSRFDTDRVDVRKGEHASGAALAALRPLGIVATDTYAEVFVSPADEASAKELLRERDVATGERPMLGVFPGAGDRSKAWPPDHFGELAVRAQEQVGADIVTVGAGKDRTFVDRVTSMVECPGLIDLPLGTLAAVLRICDRVVSSDSGPMHLAAAVGTPTVALFGPTDPGRFGPIGVAHRVVRAPRGNMDDLTVDQVWDVLSSLGMADDLP